MGIPSQTGSISVVPNNPRIGPHQCVDNRMLPSAWFMAQMANQINTSIRMHTKAFFTAGGNVLNQPAYASKAASVTRYRGAFHTGAFAAKVGIVGLAVPLDSDPGGSVQPTVQIAFTGGGSPSWSAPLSTVILADTTNPNTFQEIRGTVDIDEDSHVEFLVTDNDGARLISLCLYEIAEEPDLGAGYVLPHYQAIESPIYSWHREVLSKRLWSLWRDCPAHVFNFPGVGRRTSATKANICDSSNTTMSASAPALVIDMRYRATKRERVANGGNGVPCYFGAWGQNTTATGGVLELRDSSNTVLATLSNYTTAGEWQWVALNLPDAKDRYGLYLAGDGAHQFNVFGVSCYAYSGANPP